MADYDFSKMSRAELSRVLSSLAPENSEEMIAFHDANHYYEAAKSEREAKNSPNSPNYDDRFRMKARRRFLKGCDLREERLGV